MGCVRGCVCVGSLSSWSSAVGSFSPRCFSVRGPVVRSRVSREYLRLRRQRQPGELLDNPRGGRVKPLARDGGWLLVKYMERSRWTMASVARWQCERCGSELDLVAPVLGRASACVVCWRDLGVARVGQLPRGSAEATQVWDGRT